MVQLIIYALLASSNTMAGTAANLPEIGALTGEESQDMAPPETPSWQIALDNAQKVYVKEDYKSALPEYLHAVEEATRLRASAADKVKCLRYLGDCYVRLNQPGPALKQFESIQALLKPNEPRHEIANLNDMAVCHVLAGDFPKALTCCNSAIKLSEQLGSAGRWSLSLTRAHQAYVDYVQAKYKSAVEGFAEAEKLLEAIGAKDIHALVFQQKIAFATAGSYYHLKDFVRAQVQFKKVYDLDVKLFGKSNLQTGWAMLALSDVSARNGDKLASEDWYKKAIYVFRKFNSDRIYKQYERELAALPEGERRDPINRVILGLTSKPAGMEDSEPPLCSDASSLVTNHDPASIYARPFTDAPGRVWVNPLVKQKGIILGVHGLSLQHSSFDALASRLADQGYCTVAFDVRGFGTYRQAFGAEQLDFEGCLQDLNMVARALKQDSPDKPLFVMGESMGGAIAVQFAAKYPELVDGLIASVPAGKRFNERVRTLKVAVRFLGNRHKPFDIGTDVINQATHDPDLKHAWADNPMTRTVLSPLELVHFSRMLRRNIESAKQIKTAPVIIYQGVGDELVKPEATYELFRSIGSTDKSLTMVGNAEHLIFEEGRFTPTVLQGLIAWMDSHLATTNVKKSVSKS